MGQNRLAGIQRTPQGSKRSTPAGSGPQFWSPRVRRFYLRLMVFIPFGDESRLSGAVRALTPLNSGKKHVRGFSLAPKSGYNCSQKVSGRGPVRTPGLERGELSETRLGALAAQQRAFLGRCFTNAAKNAAL